MYAIVQRLEVALSEAMFALTAEGEDLHHFQKLYKRDPNYQTALDAALDAAIEILDYDPRQLPRTRDTVLTAEEVRQAALVILTFRGENSGYVHKSAVKPLRILRRALLILEPRNRDELLQAALDVWNSGGTWKDAAVMLNPNYAIDEKLANSTRTAVGRYAKQHKLRLRKGATKKAPAPKATMKVSNPQKPRRKKSN